MTDKEAIEIAKKYGLPIVHIPPTGCINEVITVNLLNPKQPVVSRKSHST